MSMNHPRLRWTSAEDALLREGFRIQSAATAGNGRKINWNEIAKLIPGRNNKDCRKRYFNEVAGCLKKGPWTEGEDHKLRSYVQQCGPSWAAIAQRMQNRSADQCSKRWSHCLDPALERRPWTDEENQRLLAAINTHGNSWKNIQMNCFPTKSANNVKNQYTILARRVKSVGAEAHPCHSQRSHSLSDSSESAAQNSPLLQIDELSPMAFSHNVFNLESPANFYQLSLDYSSMNTFPLTDNVTSEIVSENRGRWSNFGYEVDSPTSPLYLFNMSETNVPGFNTNLPTPTFGAGSGDFAADSLSWDIDMDLNRNGSMMCMVPSTSSAIQASTLDDAVKQVLALPPWIVEQAGGDGMETVLGNSRITFEIEGSAKQPNSR